VTREGLEALRPNRADYAVNSVSHELWFLLDQCWSVDPQLRPTMGQILGSPAFGITQKKESWTVPRLRLMPFVSRPRFCSSEPIQLIYSLVEGQLWWGGNRIRGLPSNTVAHQSSYFIFLRAPGLLFPLPSRGSATSTVSIATRYVAARTRRVRKDLQGTFGHGGWSQAISYSGVHESPAKLEQCTSPRADPGKSPTT
jgi:hypothetical protein